MSRRWSAVIFIKGPRITRISRAGEMTGKSISATHAFSPSAVAQQKNSRSPRSLTHSCDSCDSWFPSPPSSRCQPRPGPTSPSCTHQVFRFGGGLDHSTSERPNHARLTSFLTIQGQVVFHRFRSSGRLIRRWFPGVRDTKFAPQSGSSSASRRRIVDSLRSSWSAATLTGTQSLSSA